MMLTATGLMALEAIFQPDGKVLYQTSGKTAFPTMIPLEIMNGKAGNAIVTLGKPEISRMNGNTILRYKTVSPAMEITSSWCNTGKILRNIVTVKNLSDDQLFLLVRQNMGLPETGFRYWNGRQLLEKVSRNSENSELYNSFPMGCVYTEKQGFAIGIEPMQIFNHIENGVQVNGGSRRVYYGVKLVVDPKKSEKVEFLAFDFVPDYGYRNAVAEFQDASDGNYAINPKVDPRLTKGSLSGDRIYYEKLWNRGDIVREYVRRQSGSWVWGYAPFHATGDWYGRREVTEDKNLHTNTLEIPDYDEFIARRKKAIDMHEEYNQAFFYYIITFCDEKLMKHSYPDCWITDKNTSNRITPWVFGKSVECRIWGWNNKFGEDTVKAIKQINDNLDVRGFAFDCSAAPGIARKQPGVQTSPGRAWDKEGVFVREAVATAMWMDVVHSLRKGPYILGTVGNMAGGGKSLYYTSIRSDALNNDGSFSDAFTSPGDQEVMRFMCGNKPFNYCNDFDAEKYGTVMPWRDYSPEKIREVYNALRDNVILFMFRYAYYPYPNGAWGCEKIVRYLPIAQEVINQGYQTIPAIRVSGKLWFSRYGKGLNTCFFIGNQSLKAKEAVATVDCKYLGNDDYAFACMDGKALDNTLNERFTKLEKRMSSKEIFLFRPVMAFPAGVKDVRAKAFFKADFTGGTSTVEFTAGKPVSGKITFRLPEACEGVEIRFNGKTVAEGTDHWTLQSASSGKLEFIWKSSIYRLSVKELLDFPFGKALIYLPTNADKYDRYAAKHLAEYFKFYDKVTGGTMGAPQIMPGTNPVPGAIRFITGNPGVTLSPDKSLLISGPTAKDRFELTFKVMRLLDRKYFYFGKFADPGSAYARDPATQEMRTKGGIGKGANWPGM